MGCASSKAPYCFQLKRSHHADALWDDNRALREAAIEELTQAQIMAFGRFWEKVYVKEMLDMPSDVQNALEIAIEERKNDPSKAEAFKA